VDPAQSSSSIEHDISLLQSLAKKLRNQRFQSGTLCLESLTLSFNLNEDGFPTDCGQYERTEANTLVEEVCDLSRLWLALTNNSSCQFMLLANISVAQQIAVHLPEQALLRRHDIPIERRLVSFTAVTNDLYT